MPLSSPIFIFQPLLGGAVPVVSAVSYGVVDSSGGGERIVVAVNDSTGCTTIAAGGVSFTSFTIDDATHVSGIPGAHASGVVNVVVTNTAGPSTTGIGLIEYFAPNDLGPTCELLPGAYSVTGTQGIDAVGTWTDTSGLANHAISNSGINAPAAVSGIPDFVAFDALFLSIAQSIASGLSVPPNMATLAAGTQINCFEADIAATPDINYTDSVISVGNSASAGIVFNTNGISWEAYDEVTTLYYRPTEVRAGLGVKHFAAGRWNGTTWGCFANGSPEATITNTAGVLSNGNVGNSVELGRSFLGSQQFDGRISLFLMFATAISDVNIAKIRAWAQQRGIATIADAVTTVTAVSHGIVDTAGGGNRVVVTVGDSTGCTAISAGGVPFTSFAIDNATSVSGIPGANAAGVVDVAVTNAVGDGIGVGLIEYWDPSAITGVTRYFDSSKNVTDAGGGEVTSWIDVIAANDSTQETSANRPILTASIFGAMPSIKFTPEQWLNSSGGGEGPSSTFSYFIVMKTVSSDATATDSTYNVPLTILGGSGWNVFGVSGGAVVYKSYDVALETWGSGVNDGAAHIIGMTSDATPSRQGYIDGSTAGSASTLGGTADSYYDHIGNGYLNVDGFDGDIGAFISLGGTVISGGDLTKLNSWSKQRFGTP